MNFNQALKLMELDSNYTEEELQKKYHKFAKMYHPDALVNKSTEEQKAASEKMKKINEAKDILMKALKNEKQSTQNRSNYSNHRNYKRSDDTSKIDLKKYKENILNFIEKNKYVEHDISNEFMGIIDNFNIFVNKYIVYITNADSKDLVDITFKDYKKELKNWYDRFKTIYFNRYNIPLTAHFIIDINLSINGFYKLLKDYNHFYNNIIKEVDNIISLYKSQAYFEDIKDEVEKLREETIENILHLDYELYNYKINKIYYLNDLENGIKNLIKRISINKPLYLELQELINKNNLPFQIHDDLKKYLCSPLFIIYYYELKLDITNLLGIANHAEEIQEIEKNLTIRYNEAQKNIKDKVYENNLDYFYESIIINFLRNKKYVNFESLRLLNKINFINYEEDLNIYEKVNKNLITDKNVEIYINQSGTELLSSKHIKIDNEEYDIFTFNGEKVIYEFYNNTSSDFISLDEFMKKASEFFLTFNLNGESCISLYRLDNLVLCFYKGHLEFLHNFMLYNIGHPKSSEFGRFQNKDFVKNLLINEYYQDIEKFKNNNLKKIIR